MKEVVQSLKKNFNFHFFKTVVFGYFLFLANIPQNYKICSKTAKVINLPYYLSHFIKKNPLFDVELFSWTFGMELPYYPHPSRDLVSPVCQIFFIPSLRVGYYSVLSCFPSTFLRFCIFSELNPLKILSMSYFSTFLFKTLH